MEISMWVPNFPALPAAGGPTRDSRSWTEVLQLCMVRSESLRNGEVEVLVVADLFVGSWEDPRTRESVTIQSVLAAVPGQLRR